MRATTFALTTALILSLTSAAFAQGPADRGAVNNPGSVQSNDAKADTRTTGSAANTDANPGGRPSDHNGTARTLGKNGSTNSGAGGTSGSTSAPRP